MSVMSTCSITLDAAHSYIERGWHVLACQPKGKDPYFPLAPRAYLSATDSHYDIDEWFDQKPNINIGIAAIQSGLIIVDLDHRSFEDQIPWDLEDRLAEEAPTYTVKTGDGWHLYYSDPGNLPRIPGKIGPGIDIKYKGYVVAAPSTHPSGTTYQTTSDITPAPFPTWLLNARYR